MREPTSAQPPFRSPGEQDSDNQISLANSRVRLTYANGIATLLLGIPEESVISFTPARLESLARAIAELEGLMAQRQISGLVVRSPSKSTFCAGADLKLLHRIQEGDLAALRNELLAVGNPSPAEREFLETLTVERLPELGAALAAKGQAVFARLKKLPVRKVAAVSGRCLGGGLELALHCDVIVAAASASRFAADRVVTELGFPEPLLGLLEGWGGTERTPRRMGLPRALPFLLSGSSVEPERALKMGLIDRVVPYEELYAEAETIARGEPMPQKSLALRDRLLTHTSLGRALVRDGLKLPLVGRLVPGARSALREFPRNHYPAPHAILETVLHGLAHGEAAGGALAAKNFGELMMSPTAKALVHVMFFGTEAAKARGRSVENRPRQLTCLVAGAGQMGAGIAHALARSGHIVRIYDSFPAALERAQRDLGDWIGTDRRLTAEDRATMRGNLTFHKELAAAANNIDLAVEAVIEKAAVKQQIFAELSRHAPPAAVLCTNTSSIPLAQLAGSAQHPERFLGLHFFNPVQKMRLVEIVVGPHTAENAVTFAASLVNGLGKFPVVVQDVPGFLINRMLFPYLMEAMQLLCEGVAVSDIDRAAENFGMRLGPLKTLDLVGFDIVREVAHVLATAYSNRWQLPSLPGVDGNPVSFTAVTERFVAQKMLGKKSGVGCYLYEAKGGKSKAQELENPSFRDPAFWKAMNVQPPAPKTLPAEVIADRLVLALVNEAVRLHDEGVAGPPGPEAALALDLGSVLGFGFAPFRGGVFYYAERRGWREIYEKLSQLERQHGVRFLAWEGIARRAEI